jgi:hypothetical protein
MSLFGKSEARQGGFDGKTNLEKKIGPVNPGTP